MSERDRRALRVAVVGPCTSGKSTLVSALHQAGYDARQPAQEHSYVPDMWRRMLNPDVLIYLDVTYQAARQRRTIDWGPQRLADEAGRLAHARAHCDLYLQTAGLTVEQVREAVLAFLRQMANSR